MLMPLVATYVVEPPICAGASQYQPAIATRANTVAGRTRRRRDRFIGDALAENEASERGIEPRSLVATSSCLGVRHGDVERRRGGSGLGVATADELRVGAVGAVGTERGIHGAAGQIVRAEPGLH